MNRKNIHKKLPMRLTTLAVISAIIVLAFLQYRWAVSSGEKIINDMVKSYNFRIFGTVAQEISGIELFNDNPPKSSYENEELLRKLLEDRWNQFQTEYGKNYLISLSYYSVRTEDDNYRYSDGHWEKTAALSDVFPDLRDKPEENRNVSGIIENRINGNDFFIMQFFKESNYVIQIELNLKSFFKNIIIPAIESSFGTDTLQWESSLPDNAVSIDERTYRFSPPQTLLTFLSGKKKDYFIPLNYKGLPILHPGHEIPFRPDTVKPDKESVYLQVLSDSGESLYFERELNLAAQWLSGLILLLGIGGAYGMILYQRNRLSRLRYKEKEFVASVTHELRTPLTVIHSAADNIQSGILTSERVAQYGTLIKEQSGRLSAMIEGILLFSRLEGKTEKSPGSHRLCFDRLLGDLVVFADSITGGNGIKVKFDFGSLPETAFTDRETLELVLTNLITNAVRHGYEGGGKGEIRVKGHLKLPGTLIFTVEDDGPGIPPKEKRHIFEPFYRGERSMKNQIKGSGLGLYLVNRKIRFLGGSIRLESPYTKADGRSRKGCRFTVSIPYIEQTEE